MPHYNTDQPQPAPGSTIMNPIIVDENPDRHHYLYSLSKLIPLPQPWRAHKEFLSDRRRRPWTQTPEPGSLYAEMKKTSGGPLWVKPVYWNERQLGILGVRWHELPPITDPAPQPIDTDEGSIRDQHPNTCAPRDSSSLFCDLKKLALSTSPGSHGIHADRIAIQGILGKLWPAAFGTPQFETLHLIADGMTYPDCVPAQMLFPQMTPDNTPSSLMTRWELKANSNRITPKKGERSLFWSPKFGACYISPKELARIHHRDRFSKPSLSHQTEMRMKRISSGMDPVLVGLFLSMAQRHFYASPRFNLVKCKLYKDGYGCKKRKARYIPCSGSITDPVLGDVKLRIISHEIRKPGSYDDDAAYFLVYTATVKGDFLRRFHDPFSAFLGDDGKPRGLDIEYTRVPMWPVLGLRERMGKALGMDFVGPFDDTMPKTYVPIRARWLHDDLEERAEKTFAKNLDIVTLPGQESDAGPPRHIHPLASSSLAVRNAHIEQEYQKWVASLDDVFPSDHYHTRRVKVESENLTAPKEAMTGLFEFETGRSCKENKKICQGHNDKEFPLFHAKAESAQGSKSKKRPREIDDEVLPRAI